MKTQIIHVSPFQTAKVCAVLYFIISVPLVAVMAFSMAFMPGEKPGILFLLIAPFVYMIFGFIFSVIGSAIYNLVAKLVGGVEYTTVAIEGA